MRIRQSRIGLTALLIISLTGCWPQPGGDSGRTFSSPWPTSINATNVSTLVPAFTASAGPDTAQPDIAVANGMLFVAADRLLALDASGAANCSGTPRVCTPRWTSAETEFGLLGPVVDGDKVWVTAPGGRLRAYDANGKTACSGVPKICTAIIDVGTSDSAGVPVATAEGILVPASKFVGGGFTDALMMFDRAGQLRWSAPLGAGPEPEYVSPVVSDGTVFAVVQGQGWPRVALSTIGGTICGNGYVWPFNDTGESSWRKHLDTQGSRDMARLNGFIGSIKWFNLVPSELDGMRKLITSGGSSVSSSNYVAAAATSDGSLLVAYVPPENSGTISVNMTAMSGPARARWFDPTSAASANIATGLTNTGTRVFTVPGTNSAGHRDWVLVLER